MNRNNRTKLASLILNSKTHSVYKGINTVGRHPSAVIILKDASASHHHAIITVIDANSHYLSDLGSVNHTQLNGVSLVPFNLYKLKDQDVINFSPKLKAIYKKNCIDLADTQCVNDASQANNELFNENTQVCTEVSISSKSLAGKVSILPTIFDDDDEIDKSMCEYSVPDEMVCNKIDSVHSMATQKLNNQSFETQSVGSNYDDSFSGVIPGQNVSIHDVNTQKIDLAANGKNKEKCRSPIQNNLPSCSYSSRDLVSENIPQGNISIHELNTQIFDRPANSVTSNSNKNVGQGLKTSSESFNSRDLFSQNISIHDMNTEKFEFPTTSNVENNKIINENTNCTAEPNLNQPQRISNASSQGTSFNISLNLRQEAQDDPESSNLESSSIYNNVEAHINDCTANNSENHVDHEENEIITNHDLYTCPIEDIQQVVEIGACETQPFNAPRNEPNDSDLTDVDDGNIVPETSITKISDGDLIVSESDHENKNVQLKIDDKALHDADSDTDVDIPVVPKIDIGRVTDLHDADTDVDDEPLKLTKSQKAQRLTKKSSRKSAFQLSDSEDEIESSDRIGPLVQTDSSAKSESRSKNDNHQLIDHSATNIGPLKHNCGTSETVLSNDVGSLIDNCPSTSIQKTYLEDSGFKADKLANDSDCSNASTNYGDDSLPFHQSPLNITDDHFIPATQEGSSFRATRRSEIIEESSEECSFSMSLRLTNEEAKKPKVSEKNSNSRLNSQETNLVKDEEQHNSVDNKTGQENKVDDNKTTQENKALESDEATQVLEEPNPQKESDNQPETDDDFYLGPTQIITVSQDEGKNEDCFRMPDQEFFLAATQKLRKDASQKSDFSNQDDDYYFLPTQKLVDKSSECIPNNNLDSDEDDCFLLPTQKLTERSFTTASSQKIDDDFYLAPTQKLPVENSELNSEDSEIPVNKNLVDEHKDLESAKEEPLNSDEDTQIIDSKMNECKELTEDLQESQKSLKDVPNSLNEPQSSLNNHNQNTEPFRNNGNNVPDVETQLEVLFDTQTISNSPVNGSLRPLNPMASILETSTQDVANVLIGAKKRLSDEKCSGDEVNVKKRKEEPKTVVSKRTTRNSKGKQSVKTPKKMSRKTSGGGLKDPKSKSPLRKFLEGQKIDSDRKNIDVSQIINQIVDESSKENDNLIIQKNLEGSELKLVESPITEPFNEVKKVGLDPDPKMVVKIPKLKNVQKSEKNRKVLKDAKVENVDSVVTPQVSTRKLRSRTNSVNSIGKKVLAEKSESDVTPSTSKTSALKTKKISNKLATKKSAQPDSESEEENLSADEVFAKYAAQKAETESLRKKEEVLQVEEKPETNARTKRRRIMNEDDLLEMSNSVSIETPTKASVEKKRRGRPPLCRKELSSSCHSSISDTNDSNSRRLSRTTKKTTNDSQEKLKARKHLLSDELTGEKDDFTLTVPKKKVLVSFASESPEEPIRTRAKPKAEKTILKNSNASIPSSNTSVTSDTSLTERGKRQQKHKVIFTMLDSPELCTIIRFLKGSIVDSIEKSTVLVTERIQRTSKLLAAIGLNIPICSPKWLNESKKANRFLDPWDFLLKDPEAEKKWNFCIERSYEISKKSKLFSSYSFQLLTTHAADTLKVAIDACGGKVVSRTPSSGNFVIVAEKNPGKKFSGKQVVSPEAILVGVLQQKLLFEEFLIN